MDGITQQAKEGGGGGRPGMDGCVFCFGEIVKESITGRRGRECGCQRPSRSAMAANQGHLVWAVHDCTVDVKQKQERGRGRVIDYRKIWDRFEGVRVVFA